MNESFLLDFIYKATLFWVDRLSFAAVPPLRLIKNPHSAQRNRDIFIIFMFFLSCVTILLYVFVEKKGFTVVERGLAAIAAYRCFDIFITLLRTGIFQEFRGDVKLRDAPTWRTQRILVGVLFNYVEVVNWFAIIYRQLSLTSPCLFSDGIVGMNQAFNMSFSTMTTIGYGKYGPNAAISNAFAFFQVGIAMILLVLVVGSVLAQLTSAPTTTSSAASASSGGSPGNASAIAGSTAPLRDYVWPALGFVLAVLALTLAFGVRACPPVGH